MNHISITTDREITIDNLREEEQRMFYMKILTLILELHSRERGNLNQ